ncbi:hypothetical protein GCM10023322_17740 [Rugosimonospora acidiphila]|uniref:Uncharacterized protein n=1 Tax=Rugosimonospora acidiphila TaxID=556531 RepID=A0ABP9RPL3_9ACTN
MRDGRVRGRMRPKRIAAGGGAGSLDEVCEDSREPAPSNRVSGAIGVRECGAGVGYPGEKAECRPQADG